MEGALMYNGRLYFQIFCVFIFSVAIQPIFIPFSALSAAPLTELHSAGLSITPDPFSPNGDGRLDVVKITSALNIEGTGQTSNAVLKGDLTVKDSSGNPVAHLEVGEQLDLIVGKWNEINFSAEWDGKAGSGEIAPDGVYFYTVDLSLLRGCKGKGDNRDDLRSGQADLLGDCNSGEGNDSKEERVLARAGSIAGEITLDNTPPTVNIVSPAVGSQIDSPTPQLSVEYSDGVSGINLATAALKVDGFTVTPDADITSTGIVYTPHVPLQEGAHAVVVTVYDRAGNAAEVSATFTVRSRCAGVTPPSSGTANPFIFPEPGFSSGSYVLGYDRGGISDIEIADVNRDGYLDIVGADRVASPLSYKSRISVLLGKGNGDFEKYVSFAEKQNNSFIVRIELKDFNNDCYPDMAVTRHSPNELFIFMNNGDGSFTEKSAYPIEDLSTILTGRFNGDEYEDIAVFSFRGKVAIFLGNGDGTFSAPTNITIGSGYTDIRDMTTLDLNEDGITDLVAVMGDYSSSNDNIHGQEIILLSGSFQGGFTQSRVYATADNGIIERVVAGDFDGDGHADIVAARKPDHYAISGNPGIKLTAFLGDGSGWFSSGTDNELWAENNSIVNDYYYYYYNKRIIALDINGDKNDDIVISDNGKVYTYTSNGNGAFQYSKACNVAGNYLNFGDFDGDGDEDIVTSNGYVFVLFNRGDGNFIDRKSLPIGGNYQIESTDFDGDKRPDLVMTRTHMNWYEPLFSAVPNRSDDWSEEPFQSPRSTTYNIVGGPVSVKIWDVDGDGYADVVTANKASGTVAVLMSGGDGSLKAPVYYQAGQRPEDVVLGDFNGDNRLDIVTANGGTGDVSVLLGRGDGTFQAQKTYAAGSVPKGLAAGDFNGDGRLDIAVTDSDWDSNEVSILLGKGDGTFWDRAVHTLGGFASSTVEEGDFNNDGISDLAVFYQRSSYCWSGICTAIDLLLGKGDGTFISKNAVVQGGVRDFISGDFNKDGTLDLATFHFGSGTINVLIGDGNGTFTQSQSISQSESWPAVTGDLNNDGEADLLLRDVGSLTPWFGQGDGTFRRRASIGGRSADAMTLGDINGDGIMDIVAVEDGIKLSIILGMAGGAFQGMVSVVEITQGYLSGVNLATGDFNGDDNQDIVVSMYPSDVHGRLEGNTKVVIYFGSGYNTFVSGTVIETDYYDRAKVLAADVNGDGRTDILLQSHPWQGYEVSVFLNNGSGTFQEPLKYTVESYVGDTRLKDVTGDSYPDIINTVVEDDVLWGSVLYGVSIHAGNGDGTFRHLLTIPLGDRQWDWHLFETELKTYLNESGISDVRAVFEMAIEGASRFSGDFDNDGNIDLGTGSWQSRTISLNSGNDDGTYGAAVHYATGLEGVMAVARDFNLDGRLDIVVNSGYLLYNTLLPLLTPPSPPKVLKAAAGNSTVALSWAENGENDVEGYNVYRSLSAGGGYEKINSTPVIFPSYTDHSVTNGVTYYYTVSAVDTDDEESSYAVKVRATPQLPDTMPPVVSILLPANNQTVTNRSLFVTGTISEADARVTVNGKPAAVQKNSGTFTAYGIPLSLGENTIAVTAVDAAGNTSSSSIRVIYAQTARVEGTIKDERNGNPVPNAWVYVRDSAKEQTLMADLDGSFTALNVIPGEVTITVDAYDYDRVRIDRSASPGENIVLDIALPLYPATIRGSIYDSHTTAGVGNATVIIADPKETQTLNANANGSFEANNVAPYQVTFTVSGAGYQTYTTTRSVTNRWTNYFYFYLDPLPPSPPSGFAATPAKGYVNLAWSANSEINIANYKIYRSTTPGTGYQLIATTYSNQLSYIDGNVAAGSTYYYVIRAVSTSQQESGYSAEASAAPEALPMPTGLTATPGKGRVDLSWEAEVESHIGSYRIYRSAESGGGYALIGTVNSNTTSYADNTVTAGVTCFYVVTAVNTWSKEGGWSNEASATPEAVSLAVSITAPDDRTYHPTETAIVKGTIESLSPEVGVVLVVESGGKEGILSAGYLAEVNGRSFAAQISLLPRAMNTIKAIATLPTGEQAEAAITVYTGMDTEVIKLTPLPSSGVISAQTRTFDVTFEAEVNVAGTVTGYSWDFDGDGRVDQATSTPSTTFGYTGPGIYYPTVTVDAGSGGGAPIKGGEPSYTATTVVNVMSVEAMDAILKAKWAEMTTSLSSGDIEAAASYFSDASQEKYRGLFTYLRDRIPEIARELKNIQLIYLRDGRAKYRIRRMEGEQEITYYIYFHRLSDGVWKIHQF